jgi:hypothetical protein
MIPGSNLLRSALSVIARQTVILYRWSGRSTTADGMDVSTFSAPETIAEGSVQAVPRNRYDSMGLDYSRNYVTWFTSAAVTGVERDRSPDQFVYGSRRYEVQLVTPWNLQDGWNEILGIDIGPEGT